MKNYRYKFKKNPEKTSINLKKILKKIKKYYFL